MSSLFQTYSRWPIDIKKRKGQSQRMKTEKHISILFRASPFPISAIVMMR
ncbi:hypothetical protein S100072_01147 [Bacillus velezensis]|nr:hypothetical protein S100072_01147 [Bacillus velezensis]